jgi:FlgD Ig-like domain
VSRLPVAAFVALVLATIAAFFVTQHLKVTTPLLAGTPAPHPAAINPVNGRVCRGPGGELVDHKVMKVSFYLLHRSDDVNVYIVDGDGSIVRTLATGRHLGIKNRGQGTFFWRGREDDGSIAPDGTYYVRVALVHQGRTVEISNSAGAEPVTVLTQAPRPVVISVAPALIPQNGASVTIRFRGEGRRDSGRVLIYRTSLPGAPRLVKSFGVGRRRSTVVWDGRIHGRPAPPGTYLVGFRVTDAACNVGSFPRTLPPPPGSTPHAGVTVRYLAAQPPLDPVPAGSSALVFVDSRRQPYRWALRRAGVSPATVAGTGRAVSAGASASVSLRVRVPAGSPGLYALSVRSGSHRTAVPIVVSAPRPAPVLVVLPALTWQGLNPVDDDGDGLPNTLPGDGPVKLARPYANGLPAGLEQESALLAYLSRNRLRYDLTTDLALLDGSGPTLSGRTGVVLTGPERWVPTSLAASLRAYVQAGGHLLSLGIDSLRRSVTLSGGRALDPRPAEPTDVLGARKGALVTGNHDLILPQQDGLGLFSGSGGALRGYPAYEPITSVSAAGKISTSAGANPSAPSVVGYTLGHGVVVDIGLAGFAQSLEHNVGAQELVTRLWSVLSR